MYIAIKNNLKNAIVMIVIDMPRVRPVMSTNDTDYIRNTMY